MAHARFHQPAFPSTFMKSFLLGFVIGSYDRLRGRMSNLEMLAIAAGIAALDRRGIARIPSVIPFLLGYTLGCIGPDIMLDIAYPEKNKMRFRQ
jgi:hypothetical protein